MKPSPRAVRGAHEHDDDDDDDDEIVILLLDPHVLRVIARSVLLAAAIFWLRTMLLIGGGPTLAAAPPASAAAGETDPKWINNNPFTLRMLVADLKREGLLSTGLNNVFLGDPGSRALFLKKNRMGLMSPEYKKPMVEDSSVDFLLAPADGLTDSSSFGFVDPPFHLPSMACIRRFGSTIVAIKKISHGSVDEFKGGGSRGRRLLSVAKLKD